MNRLYILHSDEIKVNCLKYISSLPVGEKPLQVEIKPFKRKRRVEANSYYWALLTHIASEMFRLKISDQYYTPEIHHEYFKRKFLGKKVVINDTVLLLPESTADKSVIEFMDYVAQIEADAAEFGIIVPQQNNEGLR